MSARTGLKGTECREKATTRAPSVVAAPGALAWALALLAAHGGLAGCAGATEAGAVADAAMVADGDAATGDNAASAIDIAADLPESASTSDAVAVDVDASDAAIADAAPAAADAAALDVADAPTDADDDDATTDATTDATADALADAPADADADDAFLDATSSDTAAPADTAADTAAPADADASTGYDPYPSDVPHNIDLDGVLAPADAAKVASTATGGFTVVANATPQPPMAIDLGEPQTPPTGSTPLAIDVDSDGDLDLVWLDGGKAVVLQRQLSAWAWQTQTLTTAGAKLAALAAIEVDGDPDPELVALGETSVFLDRQSDGSWVDQAIARKLPAKWGFSMAQAVVPGDVDDDGLLDLLVSRFHCGNEGKPALTVLRQRGDGSFYDATTALGLHVPGDAWVAAQADIDDDGDLDVLVLTESCTGSKGSWALRHRPAGSVPLFEVTTWTKAFQAPQLMTGSPMGLGNGDLNGDGVDDYVLGEIEIASCKLQGCLNPPLQPWEFPLAASNVGTVLLLSQPGGGHASVGLQAGLWQPGNADGAPMTGWAPGLTDLDHDGFLDIVLTHGYEYAEWLKQAVTAPRPVVFRNDGTQHFDDVSKAWGLPAQHPGRTMALADLDGDGDLDLALGAQGTQPLALRNDLVHGGADLHLRLRGVLSNPWGLGARVAVQTNQRTVVVRLSVQAWSHGMATPAAHVALRPGEQAQQALVRWPSGAEVSYPLPAKGKSTLVEPPLFTLPLRQVAKGAPPMLLTANQVDASGKAITGKAQCSIELAPGSVGAFTTGTTCKGAVCTRFWAPGASAQPGDAAVFVAGCGGKLWSVRPRVDVL